MLCRCIGHPSPVQQTRTPTVPETESPTTDARATEVDTIKLVQICLPILKTNMDINVCLLREHASMPDCSKERAIRQGIHKTLLA